MASLKDVKTQIGGVKKTKQITKAMYMVSSSKLRGAQGRIERFAPYADKFGQLLSDLSQRVSNATHPLLEVHDEQKVCTILLMASERGLCGAYNINITTMAIKFANEQRAAGKEVKFIVVGKKAREAAQKGGFEILDAYTDVMNDFNFALAVKIGDRLISDYCAKQTDEVFIFHGTFISTAKQAAKKVALLPVKANEQANSQEASSAEYLYEPNEAELLTELLPKYVNCQIYRALLDTSASENGARMAAMDNATRNCDDMIKSLTLLYNKTRQAAITAELIDIVGGVEALNG